MDVREQIRSALTEVLDPEIGEDLVSLGMVKEIEVEGADAIVGIELTTPACPLKSKIEGDVREAALTVPGVERVEVSFSARVRSGPTADETPIPGVKNTIVVASGKGGVGKSTVAVNLAFALRKEGAGVGLLDCDVYGPSVPIMTGTQGAVPGAGGEKFPPIERQGVKLMSIGYLVDPAQSVVWRGPMIHKAVQQFLTDVEWGDLDYLVVDMPPGTGDAQISLAQLIPITGAVMVTTPQNISLVDVRRAADMFRRVSVPLLGVIENMSYFVCPHGDVVEIFDRGGGRRISEELGVPFLGEIPIDTGVREGSDRGIPVVLSDPESDSAKALLEVARALAGSLSRLHLGG